MNHFVIQLCQVPPVAPEYAALNTHVINWQLNDPMTFRLTQTTNLLMRPPSESGRLLLVLLQDAIGGHGVQFPDNVGFGGLPHRPWPFPFSRTLYKLDYVAIADFYNVVSVTHVEK